MMSPSIHPSIKQSINEQELLTHAYLGISLSAGRQWEGFFFWFGLGRARRRSSFELSSSIHTYLLTYLQKPPDSLHVLWGDERSDYWRVRSWVSRQLGVCQEGVCFGKGSTRTSRKGLAGFFLWVKGETYCLDFSLKPGYSDPSGPSMSYIQSINRSIYEAGNFKHVAHTHTYTHTHTKKERALSPRELILCVCV